MLIVYLANLMSPDSAQASLAELQSESPEALDEIRSAHIIP